MLQNTDVPSRSCSTVFYLDCTNSIIMEKSDEKVIKLNMGHYDGLSIATYDLGMDEVPKCMTGVIKNIYRDNLLLRSEPRK